MPVKKHRLTTSPFSIEPQRPTSSTLSCSQASTKNDDIIAPNTLIAYEFIGDGDCWCWSVGTVEAVDGNLVTLAKWRTHSGPNRNIVDAIHRDLAAKTGEMERLRGAMLAARQELAAIRRHNETEMHRVRCAVSTANEELLEVDETAYRDLFSQSAPPLGAVLALQAAVLMVDEAVAVPVPWEELQLIARNSVFLRSLVEFDATRRLSCEQCAEVRQLLLETAPGRLAELERYSVAAAAILKWVLAQTECAEVHTQCGATQARADAVQTVIAERIADMKVLQLRMEQLQGEARMYEAGGCTNGAAPHCLTFTPARVSTMILRSSVIAVLSDAGRDVLVLGSQEVDELKGLAELHRPGLALALEGALRDADALRHDLAAATALAEQLREELDQSLQASDALQEQLGEALALLRAQAEELHGLRLRDTHWRDPAEDSEVAFVVTHHERDFRGSRWGALLDTKPEALCAAFTIDASNACGVYNDDITNIAFTQEGNHVHFDVTHPASKSPELIRHLLDTHPFRETERLYQQHIDTLTQDACSTQRQMSYSEYSSYDPPAHVQNDTYVTIKHFDGEHWEPITQHNRHSLYVALHLDTSIATSIHPQHISIEILDANYLSATVTITNQNTNTFNFISQIIDQYNFPNVWRIYDNSYSATPCLDIANNQLKQLQKENENFATTLQTLQRTDHTRNDFLNDLLATTSTECTIDHSKPSSTTSLKKVFDGEYWETVLREKPEALGLAFAIDASHACHVHMDAITNARYTVGSLCVEFDVTHPSTVSGEEIAKRVEEYPFRNVWRLYVTREEPKAGLDLANEQLEELRAHDDRWVAPAADAGRATSQHALALPGAAAEWVRLAEERPEAVRAAVVADVASACHVSPDDVENVAIAEDGTAAVFEVRRPAEATEAEVARRLEQCPGRELQRLYAKREEPKTALDLANEQLEELQRDNERMARELAALEGTDEERAKLIEELEAHDERWEAPCDTPSSTTSLKKVFDGEYWETVLREKPEALGLAFAIDASHACHVHMDAITNARYTVGSLCVEFDVTHPSTVSGEEIAKRVEEYPFRNVWRLYVTREEPKAGLDLANEQLEELRAHDDRWVAPAADAGRATSQHALALPGAAAEWVRLAEERPKEFQWCVVVDVCRCLGVLSRFVDGIRVDEEGWLYFSLSSGGVSVDEGCERVGDPLCWMFETVQLFLRWSTPLVSPDVLRERLQWRSAAADDAVKLFEDVGELKEVVERTAVESAVVPLEMVVFEEQLCRANVSRDEAWERCALCWEEREGYRVMWKEQYGKLLGELDDLSHEYTDSIEKLEEFVGLLEAARAAETASREQLQQREEDLYELEEERDADRVKYEAKIAAMHQQCEVSRAELLDAGANRCFAEAQAKADLVMLRAALESARRDHAEMVEQFEAAQKEQRETVDGLNATIADLVEELEVKATEYTDTLEKLEEFVSLLETARAAEKVSNATLEARERELFDVQEQRDAEHREHEKKVHQLTNRVEGLQKELERVQAFGGDESSEAVRDLVATREALDSLRLQLDALKREKEAVEAELGVKEKEHEDVIDTVNVQLGELMGELDSRIRGCQVSAVSAKELLREIALLRSAEDLEDEVPE